MGHFDDMLSQKRTQRERDAETFKTCDDDLCMICLAYGADKRSLFISSLYEMKEIAPEFLDLFAVPEFKNRGYYLRICKSCRGEILSAIREAINTRRALRDAPKNYDGYVDYESERNIPVRIDGRTVMLADWEFEEYQRKQAAKKADDPEREP
jgi:hypothetical protein